MKKTTAQDGFYVSHDGHIFAYSQIGQYCTNQYGCVTRSPFAEFLRIIAIPLYRTRNGV